jgi:uncharacterized phage protein gp47/JayE
MADIPTPRSYQQILGDMIDAFLSKQGLRNLRVGSPILSILEAAAQSDLRSSQDVFTLLNAISLDKAVGLALERIGDDENVPKLQQAATTGTVDVTDTSFTKRSTKLFQGTPAPIAGSVSINVADAAVWPSSGQLYLGRGTPNYEGPLAYTSKTNAGTYWTITLSSGTVRFHNTSETVILAQGGDRTIGPSTIVRTPQANISDAIEFRTAFSATIPDGETSITAVPVVAQKPGIIGNVPKGAIKEFSSLPFAGASVTNPTPFSNGRETETDDEYRERIKNVRRSRALGTSLAITTSVTGITSTDENKRVSSASLVPRLNQASTLYIDDGTGYEERSAGVPMETLADSAIGGEQYFQAKQRPVARAFAVTKNSAPYTLSSGEQLAVKVGGVTYVHTFDEAKFVSIINATAYEAVASINSDPTLGFRARTVESGTKFVLFADGDANEDVEVIAADGADANDALGFPPGVNYTMSLYQNDRLLTKDGQVAAFVGESFSQWDAVSGAQTLVIAVDNTPAQTYTFVDQDFVNAGTGFPTVARNTIAAWAAVLNSKVPGINATEDAGRLVLTSTAGAMTKAAVEVLGGTLVTAHFFRSGKVTGKARDYTLDRNNSQIRLEKVLLAGDKLSIGSVNTRAFIESDPISPTTIASTAKFWFVIDGDASVVATGVTGATTLAIAPAGLHPFGLILTLTATAGSPFTNVRSNDWLVLWDPALDASLQGAFRVVEATSTVLKIERRLGTTARVGHRAAALAGSGATIGKVLISGGTAFGVVTAFGYGGVTGVPTAELYDPNTRKSTPVAPMSKARVHHSATALSNGKVVVVGGFDGAGVPLASIEIFDSATGNWTTSAASLGTAVGYHSATLLTDGRVLICGGAGGGGVVNKFQIYNPNTDTITAPGTLQHPRARHRAVKMPNDDVLIVGGYDAAQVDQATTEIWSHITEVTTASASMTRARSGFGMAMAGTLKVLVAGNRRGVAGRASYEVYTIASNTWSAEANLPSNIVFEENPLVTLTNGHAVGLHGYDSVTPTTGKGFSHDGTSFTTFAANPLSADSSVRFGVQYAEIKNGNGTIQNIVGAFGGAMELSTVNEFRSTAVIEQYDEVGAAWSVPDPATSAGVTLSTLGLAAIRTDGIVREVDIPAGTNYTAATVASALNSGLVGAVASVYRTNQLRISTNTFDKSGDIALVTQNQFTSGFGLDSGPAIDNLTGHVGAIESGNSDLGTPSFRESRVYGAAKNSTNPESLLMGIAGSVGPDYGLVGLRNWWGGANGTSTLDGAAYFHKRTGSNLGLRTRLTATTSYSSVAKVDVRTGGIQPWSPLDRAYLAAPFSIGPNDNLTVVVDSDVAKRFSINMWRKLATVGNTFSVTNTFKDADGGGVSLAATFGLNYDFNDHTVYMRARAKAYSNANQQMLFRYFRFGAEGEDARVRIGNPIAPNSSVSVGVNIGDTSTDVTIRLPSGALRTPTLNNTTRIGSTAYARDAGNVASFVYVLYLPIASASRTTNVTTLTLTLPPVITDHGFQVGDLIYVNSTDVNFTSGVKSITATSATTVSYAETAADHGATANIGTVSADSIGESHFTGSGTLVGDFLKCDNSPFFVGNATQRISAVTNGYVQTTSGDQIQGAFWSPVTTLNWFAPSSASDFKVFANPAQTASQIATAVNALAAQANSTCPVTITLLGSGAGLIDRSTPDFLDDDSAWYQLTDGVNWVQSTSSPGSVAGDYTLTFKKTITGTLATGSDWQNEEVRLSPSTTANVVGWLNAPAISGLFTVCSIQASSDGERVQIASKTPGAAGGVQVQGGSANSATAAVVGSPDSLSTSSISILKRSDVDALTGGTWVRIQNETPLPRDLPFGPGAVLLSWDADGTVIFNGIGPYQYVVPTQVKVRIERQGKFVAISDMGIDTIVGLGPSLCGSYLRISVAGSPTVNMPQVSSANQGIFPVLRVATSNLGSAGTLFIENEHAIEENAECTVTVYAPYSPMPGDTFVVASPILGVENQGVWKIRSVGNTNASTNDPFAHLDRFIVDTAERTPVPQTNVNFTLASQDLIHVVEGTPATFIMKLVAVVPNQDDGRYLDVRWDQPINASSIAASAGSVVSALDKLDFPLDFASGVDGYNYNTGLVGEANKVVYGDPSDTTTYPGVAAASARINIAGPLVKRVTLALALRIRSGVSNADVADRVRSAVATVINQTGIGQPIALSSIITAASKVVGVLSVTVVSPVYGVGNDLISVQPFEKPLVLNLDQDIKISFVGE